jgi:hypothetical protein
MLIDKERPLIASETLEDSKAMLQTQTTHAWRRNASDIAAQQQISCEWVFSRPGTMLWDCAPA